MARRRPGGLRPRAALRAAVTAAAGVAALVAAVALSERGDGPDEVRVTSLAAERLASCVDRIVADPSAAADDGCRAQRLAFKRATAARARGGDGNDDGRPRATGTLPADGPPQLSEMP